MKWAYTELMTTNTARVLATIANGGSARIPANAKELQAIRDRNRARLIASYKKGK